MKQIAHTISPSLYLLIGISTLLLGCSSENKEVSVKSEEFSQNESIDSSTSPGETLNGFELFVDSMNASNYLLDTTRIKNTMWSFLARNPKMVDNGLVIIQVPFPVDDYQHHFSHPKTYFFAQWNETEQTFKNGNDYLLMTWTIDSAGISNEKIIYRSLHEYMGNFPSYVFRSGQTVYAMCHRLTVMAMPTQKLTEELRGYVDQDAVIHLPFGNGDQ